VCVILEVCMSKLTEPLFFLLFLMIKNFLR
jgi:hypothetical protein